jgi:hypothetical protein
MCDAKGVSVDQPQRTVTQNAVIEVVAYAGAAVALVATLIAVDQAEGLGDVGNLVVALAITAVLVGAGLAIPDTSIDAFRRMHSVLWFAATIAWGISVDHLLSSVVDVSAGDTRSIVTAIVTAAGAAILWLRLRRSLQLLALWGAVLGTLITLIELTAGEFEPADPNVTAVVVWLFGIAWAASSDRGLLQPLRTGLVLGTLTAVVAPYVIATEQLGSSQAAVTVAAVWSFVTSALAVGFGALRGDRAVQGIAIAGIVVGAGVIVGDNVAESNRATIVALVVGLALLGAALAAIRGSTPASRPPAWAPPTPPAPPPAP